ncbi:hypothetical protein BJ508DRAFT_64051 [Ascobolus immersus RN42]|uniref:Extracellular membrane protein CFEM domain-containing protein n=1 Tax=Ascobolus immersus RN42 TaxID=1160509 RepID=A0A3N4INM1_ASCIM|nr:hypothetical protein BJ508DRAFT_64051 [Ascobolus immersus RN42]
MHSTRPRTIFRSLPTLLLLGSSILSTSSPTQSSTAYALNTTQNAFTYPTFTAFISDLPPCLQVCFHHAHKPIFERCEDNNWECICRNDLYTTSKPAPPVSEPEIDPVTGEPIEGSAIPPPADDEIQPPTDAEPNVDGDGESEADGVPSAESLTAREILIEEFGQCVERDCEMMEVGDTRPVLSEAAASVSQLKAFCLSMMVPPGGAEGDGSKDGDGSSNTANEDYEYISDDEDTEGEDYEYEEVEVEVDENGNELGIIRSRTISPEEKRREEELMALCTSPNTGAPRVNPLVFLTDAGTLGTATIGMFPSPTPAIPEWCGRCA